jgi:tetratricopeptide (TPR) repeat protein
MDEFEWFDLWCEEHCELMNKEDYPALVELCKQRLLRNPDDEYAWISLGEAYVLNKEYEKAIDLLMPYHKYNPDDTNCTHVILDALFAMGKAEDDFEWTKKPNVLRMSDNILDFCFNFLKPKRKPRSVVVIYCELLSEGYLLFSEEDLLHALLKDNRFVIFNPQKFWDAEVKVVRNRNVSQKEKKQK